MGGDPTSKKKTQKMQRSPALLFLLAVGIVGLILASSAKKAGFNGGIYTGALVCSIIGVVGGAGVFLASLVFIGTISSLVRWIFSFT